MAAADLTAVDGAGDGAAAVECGDGDGDAAAVIFDDAGGAQSGVVVRRLGVRDYRPVWAAMRDFTVRRGPGDADQIWLLQHRPVFTQGAGCRAMPRGDGDGGISDIPVVHSDRGGDITYHGRGQLIAYLLLDLKRRRLGVKSLVRRIEQTVIDLLGDYGLAGERRPGAPGVYLANGGGKIAALGLRIKRGCCCHGLSLNVGMDLRPYRFIDPCGDADLAVTHMREHLPAVDIGEVENGLLRRLLDQFGDGGGDGDGDGGDGNARG